MNPFKMVKRIIGTNNLFIKSKLFYEYDIKKTVKFDAVCSPYKRIWYRKVLKAAKPESSHTSLIWEIPELRKI